MKKIIELQPVSAIYNFKSQVIFKKGNELLTDKKIIVTDEKITPMSKVVFSINHIFIQHYRFKEIYVYTFSGELIKKIEEGFNLDIKKINNIRYIANRNTKTYWIIDDDLNLTNTNKYVQFNSVLNNNIIHYTSTFIKCYKNLDGDLKWEIQVADFGRNIAKDPKTGEILWDKPNEIKEALLADDKNIYVPLTGGQLLALDSQTGEKNWMWEHPRNGTFALSNKYIYKQDGLTILEVDTKTGELLRKKNFNDDVLVEKFHASGPLWVYEDLIIVCDVLYGKICMINRHTFEVEAFFSLNKKLVNSKSAIVWNDNKLYVLDIDRTLHIFEKQNNEIV